ncbi:hypothetical protein PENTCL1PPCAC_20875 [Pristionchus entomophagus]|uniref:CUB domain-containing protein n=1 Tax=Pristionchus entomophagus TaxID=358040 RepID=A0AAV5TWR9_9BILA|nr:hypothetical protein PENTCL1PPCAC_20875 [Pristionchus entomophagus]
MRIVTLSFLLLISFVHCDFCPNGYSQAPNGGDCFKILVYYEPWIPAYYPKTFPEVEADCNNAGGGLLASVHSDEENEFIRTLVRSTDHCQDYLNTNIGIRCVGMECKWDDGTNVTYTNFDSFYGPKDGHTFCFGLSAGQWTSKSCEGKIDSECWACSVKARTIECMDGESIYKGGCVSVQTSPLDGKSAREACPGGGKLVSIHGDNENSFYTQWASKPGATGTTYIGGQYVNGKFSWMDGSYNSPVYWANGFPSYAFGECVQLLLASEFGVKGQWTNIDCSDKQSYICIRDGTGTPKADPHCQPVQHFTESGSIISPNYPLSIPAQQTCEYVLETKEGTCVSITFQAFYCQSGATLSLFDGPDTDPFAIFGAKSPRLNQPYTATSNVIRMIFATDGTSPPIGFGWEAEFTGK